MKWMIIVASLIWTSCGFAKSGPRVEIALLLDTSSSMNGLIDQAKTELWKVVNEFSHSRQNGERPDLSVALYEYGKSSLNPKEGYIRKIVSLSNDLDRLSEELFALETNGGDEYCGWVIRDAVRDLEWSTGNDDLRMIFIAGNEPFTQGSVSYVKSCKQAAQKGIVVNTIFCGNETSGLNGKWKEGATLADGSFLNIDQNVAVAHIEAPQDARINELGIKLNETYIAFGSLGKSSKERQMAQDANVSSNASASVNRSLNKASGYYSNTAWDLCDAMKEGKIKLSDLKEDELPEEMKEMTLEEREAYILAKTTEREKISHEINALNIERRKYIAEKRQEQAENGVETLDSAMLRIIREQAGEKGYAFN